MTQDRIRSQRHVTAMVALDTIDLIAERVTGLLSHGRRMTIARRYTWTNHTPTVEAGLTVDGEPKWWRSEQGAGFHVPVASNRSLLLGGFGFAAYAGENDVEAAEWIRYHAGEAESTDPFKRRKDMTYVAVTGGLANDGPAMDDLLVIRPWNRDGVVEEVVVAFDTALLWQQRDAEEVSL